MTKIKCINCENVREPLNQRKGPGKGNVEYVEGMICALGYEIRAGGGPGPRCDGKYFSPK